MGKLLTVLVLTLILVGCNSSIEGSSENILFEEINDMEDVERIIFHLSNEGTGGVTLYDEDEMKTVVDEVKKLKVKVGNIEEYDMGAILLNSYMLAIVHDSKENIYTMLEVNDNGAVHIWNRYTDGEVPSFYVSEENFNFYERIVGIADMEREPNLSEIHEIPFEYKEDVPLGTSVLEIRSEEGRLIADVNDIQEGSVKATTDESGHPVISFSFSDKDFVYHFTKAHIGEETPIYIAGELIASPRIMEPILSNQILISGEFDQDSIDDIVLLINDSE